MRVCYQRTKVESRLIAELTANEVAKWDSITKRFMERNSPVNQILNKFYESNDIQISVFKFRKMPKNKFLLLLTNLKPFLSEFINRVS